jgi:hypothetical protein
LLQRARSEANELTFENVNICTNNDTYKQFAKITHGRNKRQGNIKMLEHLIIGELRQLG